MHREALVPPQVTALVGAEHAQALGEMLSSIPVAWVPSLAYVASVIGPSFEFIRGSFFTRLCDYAIDGYVQSDIEAGCRWMSSAEVQAECTRADDYLAQFARAIVAAKRARRMVERQAVTAAERAKREAWEASPEGQADKAAVKANLDAWRESDQAWVAHRRRCQQGAGDAGGKVEDHGNVEAETEAQGGKEAAAGETREGAAEAKAPRRRQKKAQGEVGEKAEGRAGVGD